MPDIETHGLDDTLVLWEKIGTDRHGEPILADPIEISGDWVENRRESLTADGQTIAIDATADVDRRIAIGSILWKGELADFTYDEPNTLFQVHVYNEVPDIRKRTESRSIELIRFRNYLPGYGEGDDDEP